MSEVLYGFQESVQPHAVPGLTLYPAWLSEDEQRHCELAVSEALSIVRPTSLKQDRSRVLRFGWSYTAPLQRLFMWPSWLEELRLKLPHVPPASATAITLNEYAPGHRIGPHVDSDLFGEPVQIVSLGAEAIMDFSHEGRIIWSQRLPAGSLSSLEADARWKFQHAIVSVDVLRYSIVFREVLTDKSTMTMTTGS